MLTGLAVSLQVVLGLILAHLLIEQVPGIQFFRSIGMIAWVLPIIASVVMFRFITLPNYGFINILLNDLGVGHLARNWFGDEKYAFLLILIMHLWRNVPFYAISFMAAMQAIPYDLYEAARSTDFQLATILSRDPAQFALHHFGMVVLHVTFTFNNFDFVYLSTGGGPVNSTEVLPPLSTNRPGTGTRSAMPARAAWSADCPRRLGIWLPKIYRRILGGMKKSKRRLVIVYAGLFIFYAFLLLPIVWLVLSSFRNTDSIQSGRLLPYPSD